MVKETYFDLRQSCFALVDANNFYVSCERIFNPKLWGKPTLVLSNNDGCAIARSDEVKKLGIEMGAPLFKIRHLVKAYNINVLSANFALYGDISERITNILVQNAPEVIVYSIDESFLDLRGFSSFQEVEKLCLDLVKKIYRYVSVPVSIGVANTKTLAKVANRVVKKHRMPSHVFILKNQEQVDQALKQMAVSDVWGIGRKWSQKLGYLGMDSALSFKQGNADLIQKRFNIVLARTMRELQGVSCIEIEDIDVRKKSIMVSRSFGDKQKDLRIISEALATFVGRAAEKLRGQNSVAGSLIVMLQTNLMSQVDAKYRNSMSLKLSHPTCDTRLLIKKSKYCLEKIFREGLPYKKVGVLLTDIQDAKATQMDIFLNDSVQQAEHLMETIDLINQKMGKSSIYLLAQGVEQPWQMKQERLSGVSLSNWRYLPIAHCQS